jgi:hypothetical protein
VATAAIHGLMMPLFYLLKAALAAGLLLLELEVPYRVIWVVTLRRIGHRADLTTSVTL